MNRLLSLYSVFAILILAFSVSAEAQESIRTIDQPGEFSKYLTPGMVDRWIFEGGKNETVVVRCVTKEFDSVLQLVQVVDDEEKLLVEIDDEGSNSSLAFRLPAEGRYKIRVQGYERRGGGNYSLALQQFTALPLTLGEPAVGKYDRQGKAFFYFKGGPDLHFTVDAAGFTNHSWVVLDPQGLPVPAWGRMLGLSDEGEYIIQLHGRVDRQFELTLRPSERGSWEVGMAAKGELVHRGSQVIDLECEQDDFRAIELLSRADLQIRVVHSPRDEEAGNRRLGSDRDRPEIVFLPVVSKGGHHRFAFVAGRTARYQLQIKSELGGDYEAGYEDPLEELAASGELVGELPVGSARFFVLDGAAAQSISAELESESFDPILRLYGLEGRELMHNDDGPNGLGSQIRHTSYSPRKLVFMVSSVGSGGGGEFELQVRSEEPNELVLGQVKEREVGTGGIDQWVLAAKAGQTVVLHARAEVGAPSVSVRSESGVELARSPESAGGTDSVLSYQIPRDGNYSVWVRLPSGSRYRLQALSFK